MKTITYDESMWQLVPKEPTDIMTGKGLQYVDGMASMPSAYRAMLSAAPQPPSLSCNHSYHYFGDYPVRRCNKCNELETAAPQPEHPAGVLDIEEVANLVLAAHNVTQSATPSFVRVLGERARRVAAMLDAAPQPVAQPNKLPPLPDPDRQDGWSYSADDMEQYAKLAIEQATKLVACEFRPDFGDYVLIEQKRFEAAMRKKYKDLLLTPCFENGTYKKLEIEEMWQGWLLRDDTPDDLLQALKIAIHRLEDMLKDDDGQAYREAEKALPALRAIAGREEN